MDLYNFKERVMKLAELYNQTPVEQHENIIVKGDIVYIKEAGGARQRYFIVGDGELEPLRQI